jgi:hypothetical protein
MHLARMPTTRGPKDQYDLAGPQLSLSQLAGLKLHHPTSSRLTIYHASIVQLQQTPQTDQAEF